DRLAREDEEAFLTRLHLVIAGREIAQQEASRAVRFRAIALTRAALQRDFRGGYGHVIFIHNDARAVSGIRSRNFRHADSAQKNKERRDSNSRTHALSWPSRRWLCSVFQGSFSAAILARD